MIGIPVVLLVLIAFAALWWHGANRQSDLTDIESYIKYPEEFKKNQPEKYAKILKQSKSK